jgi:hypothetical protein
MSGHPPNGGDPGQEATQRACGLRRAKFRLGSSTAFAEDTATVRRRRLEGDCLQACRPFVPSNLSFFQLAPGHRLQQCREETENLVGRPKILGGYETSVTAGTEDLR